MQQLPNLNDIFNKNVEKFNGQPWLYDMYFYFKRLQDWELIIPVYQRSDVWSLEQKQNLIRSLYYGITIPPIILNERETNNYEDPWHLYIIDWSQRIRTLQQFFNSELEVDWFIWNEMHDAFKTKFLHIPLQSIRTNFKTEDEEKFYYYLFNTSWTHHTQNDINKVL